MKESTLEVIIIHGRPTNPIRTLQIRNCEILMTQKHLPDHVPQL